MTRKILIAFLSLALVGALLLASAAAVFCNATLRKHSATSMPPEGAATVTMPARDGTPLNAWWFRNPHPTGNCVAILHGIGDSSSGSRGFAPMFLDQGYSVLLPDSRAHGASGGEFVTYGLLEKYDAIDWAKWMKGAGCGKVFGLGESLGAAVLIQAAGEQPAFDAIVAECAYADLRQIAEYRVSAMNGLPPLAAKVLVGSALLYADWVDHLDLSDISPVKSIARASTPILLIHGLKDFRTPPSNSIRLAQANPRDALWMVPDAIHTGASAAEPREFQKRVLAWFASHGASRAAM